MPSTESGAVQKAEVMRQARLERAPLSQDATQAAQAPGRVKIDRGEQPVTSILSFYILQLANGHYVTNRCLVNGVTS